MYKVRIVGAGSIGNHLANAFVNNGFNVEVTDKDFKALERMKNEIYPQRFGSWDERINIITESAMKEFATDVLVIGTPPDTHLQVVFEQLNMCTPRLVFIEKPLANADISLLDVLNEIFSSRNIRVIVGYNHRLTLNTEIAVELLNKNIVGKVLSITSQTRESWNGILKAHPWLNGPEDTYLASIDKGGGALFEHSHALNLLLYFIDICNLDRIELLTASLDIVSSENANYDRFSFLTMVNKSGNIFHVIQDVVTNPPLKELRINGTAGDLIWRTSNTLDEVLVYDVNGEIIEDHQIKKNRRDDFYPEIRHVKFLLESNSEVNSPLDLKYAIDTNKIIVSAFESHNSGKKITIKG